ncbi:MAG: NfeD family protein [Clostridiaceae bacterium]
MIPALILWLIIAVAALLFDMMTSAFLFIWFSMGAIIAMILDFMGVSFSIQVLVFIISSLILLAVGYPIVKKTIKKTVPKTPLMEENYIGRELIVDDQIVQKSMVKIEGIYWTIKNQSSEIKKGDKIRITGIDGNKLVVSKIEEE